MHLGLENKVAIVSGASRGLGFAAARALAEEGARLIICSRRKTAIEDAAWEIEKLSDGTAVPVVADVTKPEDIERVVQTAESEFGTVHILVNNTGGPPVASFDSLTDEMWRTGFDLLLMSMIRFIRKVLPYMELQSWGRVVTISSIAAKQPIDDLVISSTLRPGIHALNRMLTNRYASKNILFNAVTPGFIRTKRFEEILAVRAAQSSGTVEERADALARTIPVERLGRPEEVGELIAFLASDKAGYISGATIPIDGGLSKGLF
jgi:3-oxoacyl-[acyl-carrier protein] reductase